MSTLNNLDINDNILYTSFNYHGLIQQIILTKTISKDTINYFFRCQIIGRNGIPALQGYMYFTLDDEKKKSKFIGVYINPSYRRQGISTLLISIWIKFCLDNGYEFLTKNRKQRKPFVLYQLKGFNFELDKLSLYDNFLKVIYICQKDKSNSKYLFFKDNEQKLEFLKGKIITSDNYQVLDDLDGDSKILERVILSKAYNLQDNEKAYTKSLEIYNSMPRR